MRRLPPLNAVRVFEAVARHLNMSRAAEELGVTQGAVSKQVLTLEDYIGARLFERHPGGLTLTDEGRSLRDAMTPAFGILDEAFGRFSRRPPGSNVFRLATISSFASIFLAPRLDLFDHQLPHVKLEILASERLVDLLREDIDLSVRYGFGAWVGLIARPLVEGVLVPVCAPKILARAEDGNLEAVLTKTRRMQAFASNEWVDWCRQADVDLASLRPAMIVEDFLVALRAAISGQALALLPQILVREYIDRNELVAFSGQLLRWPQTYHIVHAPNADGKAITADVIAWLEAEAAKLA